MNPHAPSPSAARAVFASLRALLLLAALHTGLASAATFYVSPTGNDSNAGTQAAPFLSIAKAQSVASSGDVVRIRGGTYSSFAVATSDNDYHYVHNLTKSGVTYEAYPGEVPVFDFTNVSTGKRVAAFRVASSASDVTIRGIHVTGVRVGSQKQSECFRVLGNATFDRVVARDSQANGFYFTSGGNGRAVNCDAYNLVGTTSLSHENTDGFGAHGGEVLFRNCRVWNVSDDGFDAISSDGVVTLDRCWAYDLNQPGNGNGFKIGGYGNPPPTVPSHLVKYSLAANCKNAGFYSNHHPGKAADWLNNTAYNNKPNFNMMERVSTADSTSVPGTREVVRNNIAFVGTAITNQNLPAANLANNSWQTGVDVTAAHFQSTDASQMTRVRPSSGTLPTITFMHKVSGTPFSGMGCY